MNIFFIIIHKPLKLTQISHLYLYFKRLHPLITTKWTSQIPPCQGLKLNLSWAAERQNVAEQHGGTKNTSRRSLYATRAGEPERCCCLLDSHFEFAWSNRQKWEHHFDDAEQSKPLLLAKICRKLFSFCALQTSLTLLLALARSADAFSI